MGVLGPGGSWMRHPGQLQPPHFSRLLRRLCLGFLCRILLWSFCLLALRPSAKTGCSSFKHIDMFISLFFKALGALGLSCSAWDPHCSTRLSNCGAQVQVLYGTWNLSSSTKRDQTWVPSTGRWTLDHWATREAPKHICIFICT